VSRFKQGDSVKIVGREHPWYGKTGTLIARRAGPDSCIECLVRVGAAWRVVAESELAEPKLWLNP